MKSLLTVSDAAWQHIAKLMSQSSQSQHYFYLTVYETGCTGYMYSPSLITKPAEDDIAIELENGATIYISKISLPAINGTHIDYEQSSLGQKQLTYHNPNAEDLCGCGESFNLKPGIEAPGVKRYSGKIRG